MRLLYIVNVDWFFLSHRAKIARAALEEGYEVYVTCSSTNKEQEIIDLGFNFVPAPDIRGATGVLGHLALFFFFFRIIIQTKPDVLHLVTIKPVIIGGLAARFLRVPRILSAISGLGYTFTAQGPVAQLRKWLIGGCYRLSLRNKRNVTIFQNLDDFDVISAYAGLEKDRTLIIPGSGVNISKFQATSLPDGVPVVVFAARLLKDKGIREFVHAAANISRKGVRAKFILAGDRDPYNPASIDMETLRLWTTEGHVKIIGHAQDIRGLYEAAHMVVLPSYREGMPLSLLEAAASGRAIITSDVPGCRETVVDGVTGALVPPRDVPALTAAIEDLLRNPSRCAAMGVAGRKFAEMRFDERDVIASHLKAYSGARM